jgi:hypothetical protein
MTRRGCATVALTMVTAASQTESARALSVLTCETSGAYRHCFDHHGYESTEERSGDYVHGWDNQGRAWTTWSHDGLTHTWPTR